jgi:hypothetical protein
MFTVELAILEDQSARTDPIEQANQIAQWEHELGQQSVSVGERRFVVNALGAVLISNQAELNARSVDLAAHAVPARTYSNLSLVMVTRGDAPVIAFGAAI